MISLLQWAKREGISYSHAQKMLNEGSIIGATRTGTGKRILVPVNFKLPERVTVTCAVCGKAFPQITGTHLKTHGMTTADYAMQFPEDTMVGAGVVETIRTKLTGIVRSEEFRENVSKGRTGITPQNHPRFVIGAYTASDETRQKMSEAHTGLKHTEESKAKIGDAHRGIPETAEAIEKYRSGQLKYYETHEGFFTGKHHTEANRKILSAAMQKYQDGLSAEQKAERAEQRAQKTRGMKRTDAQKATYRESRSKYMEENPHKMVDTAGERTIKAWLESNEIVYKQQFRIPGHYHPYDFFLPAYNTIIEFDGSHHWIGQWWDIKDKTQAELDLLLKAQQEKDANESKIAEEAGYRIIRLYGRADVGCKEWGTMEEQLANQGFALDDTVTASTRGE